MSDVHARILLWGIAGSGKTTTLETIHAKLRADLRGELRRTPTRLDPSVSYESLQISLGEVGGVGTNLELIAVPGADDQAMTRKQLLDEIDGVVLVVDCSPEMIESNFGMIDELRASLDAYGRSFETLPMVLQYNKRDIADPFAIEALHRRIGLDQAAVFETIATTGHGILATLTTISKHVVRARKGGTASQLAPVAPAEPASAAIATDSTAEAGVIGVVDVAAAASEPAELDAAEFVATLLTEEDTDDLGATDDAGSPQDFLEAAILAEGDEEGLDSLLAIDPEDDDAAIGDLGRLGDALPEWQASVDPGEDSKSEMNLGGALRIVSVGQASVEADGGLRVPIVLGDEAGQSRSMVLSLRLDALVGDGND